ncbi:MAG: hypothetical protein M3R59_09230 [Verrucomicrobiota bacterium]|nr:hypothetical protein [Verrucomicrobiota bacterium]
MKGRVLLAGILGGIVMFFWNWVAHDLLPLGTIGLSEIPNEKAVLAAMDSGIGNKPGLYFFPGFGANATRAQKEAAMSDPKRLEENPSGLMVYHPPNTHPLLFVRSLSIEFLAELVESLLAVYLLAQTAINSFGGRWFFVTVVGVIAAIATNISYWNWYGFPGDYTAAYILMQLVGFVLTGLLAAVLIGKRPLPA